MPVTVAGLGRARVKGTRWEWLDTAVIDAGGLAGDRSWALVDDQLRCLRTARHPELTRLDAPSLDDLAAAAPSSCAMGRDVEADPTHCGPTAVEYWGRPIEADLFDHPWCAEAGAATGVPARLARATSRPGFIWELPVSVLPLSELQGLPGLLPDGSLDEEQLRRYRPNVLLDDRDAPLVLHAGSVARLGEVELVCRERLERCTVINHGVAGSDRLYQGLRESTLGWGCEVVTAGDVSRGTVAELAG